MATKSPTAKKTPSKQPAAKKAAAKKPAAKKSVAYKTGHAPTRGPGRTSQVLKGTDKIPVPEDSEIKIERKNTLHIGAAIARRGKRGLLTNEQRRMLARATEGLSPLEFALSTLRDESASQSSRQWATEVLMPYVHHRLPTSPTSQNSTVRAGVLVAPGQLTQEEWIAQYAAQPADVVDIEFKDVTDLTSDKNA